MPRAVQIFLLVVFLFTMLLFFVGPFIEARADASGASALKHIKVGMSYEEAARALKRQGFSRQQILVYKRIGRSGSIETDPASQVPTGEPFGIDASRSYVAFTVEKGPEDINVIVTVRFDASGHAIGATYDVHQAYL